MGSPISSMVSNLFMEEFESTAISTAPNPRLWLRYVDVTFVIQQAEHNSSYSTLISIDPHIKITEVPAAMIPSLSWTL